MIVNYKVPQLTDVQLEKCFHFFHPKHKNSGNFDTARCPSDAILYEFIIERFENRYEIKLYEYFKSYRGSELIVCSKYTNLGLVIKNNWDFIVLSDGIMGYNDVHYQRETTYNIMKFHKFLENLILKSKLKKMLK